jgi:hypothetical protein
MKPVCKTYAVLAVIGVIAVSISLLFDVSPCPIYHIFRIPCFACGLTRAFISLARLDIRAAFFYHPLFFLVPFLPWLAWEKISHRLRNILSFIVLGLLAVVWAVRMFRLYS